MSESSRVCPENSTPATVIRIFDALAKLIYEKKYEDVSITDICREANIHRTTFYNYFDDKEDLLNSILDYSHLDFQRSFPSPYESPDFGVYSEKVIEAVLTNIDEHQERFRLILTSEHNDSIKAFITRYFTEKLRAVLGIFKKRGLLKVQEDVSLTFLAELYMGGFISVCIWWLKSDGDVTKQCIMNNFQRISRKKTENTDSKPSCRFK